MTPGGWCSSCALVESLKPFASVRRAIRPGDSIFRTSQITTFSCPYVVTTNNGVCRWTYIEFYSRYSILMSQQETDLKDKKQTCKNVLQRVIQVSLFFSVMHRDCALHVCTITLASSLGPQPVQVWPHKDLLPSRSGGLSGEAASGPAEESLRDHPETRAGVEPEEEVPAHEGGSHRPPGVHPGKEDDPVRGVHRLQFSRFYKPSVIRNTFLLTMVVWLKRGIF